MIEILLFFLGILCLLIMFVELSKKDGIYQFPFWAAGTFAGFVLIQLMGLAVNADRLPPGALEKTILMAILCLLMVSWGAYLGDKPFRIMSWRFSQSRLLKTSFVLSLVGAIFFFQISRLPEELTSASQSSGIFVAYRFFEQAMMYGMAIAILLYMTTSSRIALAIFLFDLLFYLDRIFIAARRGETAELIVIVVLAFWFGRKQIVPRICAVFVLVLGVLFIYSTGEYREKSDKVGFINAIQDIAFKDNLHRVIEGDGSELINTVYEIEAVDRLSNFDLGAFQWNKLVFNYVPAQMFGSDFKRSLMITEGNFSYTVFGHQSSTGSTSTGMADAFRSFWFFGAFLFFLIAYILARIYKSSISGYLSMQLVYMLMFVNSLHTITHNTNWFVSPWVHIVLFLTPALLYARR